MQPNTFSNQQHPEMKYLNALRYVLEKGEKRETRNSVTRSVFGLRMEFLLYSKETGMSILPLLTTKNVFWKGVAQELLWFIKADTDAKHLDEKGVKIWNGNSSRQALDDLGLRNYEEGDCGPIYGFQWRHFGAEYYGPNLTRKEEGVDQLGECIELLRSDPYSRRIFMSAWNASDLNIMCLPPCHVSYQFYVSNKGGEEKRLYCQMYQRSADMFLGIPFNIASVSLLTHMIAQVTGLKPGGVILVIGDAHIYESHLDVVQEQLSRQPLEEFPTIRFEGNHTNIDDIKFEDIVLENYKPQGTLKAAMVV